MRRIKQLLAVVAAFGLFLAASPAAANAAVTHGTASSVVVKDPYPGS